MISLKVTICIGIACFVLGELCGVFCIALCSANKRHEVKDEVQ